jgi:hypothetical protein
MNRKICTLLVFTSRLAGFLTIFPPLMLILKLNFCASNVIDHFSCDYPYFTVFMLRYMAVREDYLLLFLRYSVIQTSISDSVLHMHHNHHIENSICQPEEKGFLHLFLSVDCHLHLLWNLYICVCQAFSNRKHIIDQRSSCSQHFSCSHFEHFYLYLEKSTSKTSFQRPDS